VPKAGEYDIQLHSDGSFLITLSEVFNSGWTTVGSTSTLVPSFGLMNGFYIDKVGDYAIVARYAFNTYYDIGLWPTLGTLFALPVILLRKQLPKWGLRVGNGLRMLLQKISL
jgi:hypothetical protein